MPPGIAVDVATFIVPLRQRNQHVVIELRLFRWVIANEAKADDGVITEIRGVKDQGLCGSTDRSRKRACRKGE